MGSFEQRRADALNTCRMEVDKTVSGGCSLTASHLAELVDNADFMAAVFRLFDHEAENQITVDNWLLNLRGKLE